MRIIPSFFKNPALWLATFSLSAVQVRAQEIDLTGFENAGNSVITQVRDGGLPQIGAVIVFMAIGIIALFTKFLDWKWVIMSIVGLFFIFGSDNVVDPIINFVQA